jgi:hypothetical protein
LFDNIVIEDVYAKKSTTPLAEDCFRLWEDGAIETLPVVWLFNDINITNLTIKNVYRSEDVKTDTSLIKIEKEVAIDRLVLDNIYQKVPDGSNSKLVEIDGKIKTLLKNNVTE